MFLLLSIWGCGKGGSRELPVEEFEQIYSDILFLGGLYRDDSLVLRHAIDSLLQARNTDTSAILAAAGEIADDPDALAGIYRNIIERFEAMAARDTARPSIPALSE